MVQAMSLFNDGTSLVLYQIAVSPGLPCLERAGCLAAAAVGPGTLRLAA